MTGMGLYETETGFYKRQFRFFQPEPEYFEPFRLKRNWNFKYWFRFWQNRNWKLIFCPNSGQNFGQNQFPVLVLPEPKPIFEISVPFQPEPEWLTNIPVPVERTGIVFCKIRFPFCITPLRSYPTYSTCFINKYHASGY